MILSRVFQRKYHHFAKQVDIHLKPPKAIEDGRYIQVSFIGGKTIRN